MKTKLHSIRTKICAIITASVLITGLVLVFMYSFNVKNQLSAMAMHYTEDDTQAYGELLDMQAQDEGEDATLSVDNLKSQLADVSLEGMETSYAYVVSKEGTMLYHPTPEKIGQPVENSVVKGIVSDLEAGNSVENGVVSYDFNGTRKYAGTYVSKVANYILIITVDEDEIFQGVNAVNYTGIVLMVVLAVIFIVISLIIQV